MPTERLVPYRPSNDTEGAIFEECWCDRCEAERGGRSCRIHGAALAYETDEPGFPPEWVSLPDGSGARCTAFRERSPRVVPMRIRDRRQIEMPFPKTKRTRV
jgi:hypothetical protein